MDIVEYKRYSFLEIQNKFGCDETEVMDILKRLKEYGIVKLVNNSQIQLNLSDLLDSDLEIGDVKKNDCFYVFVYVGLITISKYIIKCYPKYIQNEKLSEKEFKQVIKVIKKYNENKKQNISLFNENPEEITYNMLSIIIYLIEDYYENGLYSNYIKVMETDGNGEINWDKTINETQALIHNRKPYYLELYTKKNINDNENYFKLLHEFILTECTKKLKDAKLLNLFDFKAITLSNNTLNDFGSKQYVLYRINQELNVQFNNRKQSLLKAMYFYIKQEDYYHKDNDSFNCYGTNSYNLVWEDMCGSVLNNKLKEHLYELNLKNSNIYDKNETLLSIIEKPKWYLLNELNQCKKSEEETLIPDSITFYDNEHGLEFIIFDAKYYKWPLNRKPGINDIIKQYIYELAYEDFMKKNGFVDSKNCFLIPYDGETVENKGFVELNILKKLGLKNIQVILLPAKTINQLYIENKELDISKLKI